MAEELPPALQELVATLQADGFMMILDHHDQANFGNRVVELADPKRETGRAVRLVRDRGLWSVEIEIARKWRDPYQVLLAIDGSKHATRASSHEERLRFTLQALERMPPASAIQPLVERLEAFSREYWRRFEAKRKTGD